MQPPGGGPDQFGQTGLDIEMDVFQFAFEDERTGVYFLFDGGKAVQDRRGIGLGDDFLLGQHTGMGTRAGDILFRQALVEVDRRRKRLHDLRGPLRETPAPHLICRHGPLPFTRHAILDEDAFVHAFGQNRYRRTYRPTRRFRRCVPRSTVMAQPCAPSSSDLS